MKKTKEKPSERIAKIYDKYFKEIMRTARNDADVEYLERTQLHSVIAEIADILDEIYELKINI